MASFDERLNELAGGTGLSIGALVGGKAKLAFQCKRETQTLWIVPYGDGIWEFSCVSVVIFPTLEEFPQPIVASTLAQNSKNKRGFWCIEDLNGRFALEYMHNIPEYLLDAQEFNTICWNVVTMVDNLESAILA